VTERRGGFGGELLDDLFRTALDPGYADAARRRAERGPQPRWRRWSARGGSSLALGVLGFLLAVAYHQAVATEPEVNRVRADLVDDVRSRQGETDQLAGAADKLRDDVDRLREQALGGTGEADRLRNLAGSSGLAKVSGPGVTIRVADGPPPVDPVTGKPTGQNPGRIRDRDLQDIANSLWRVGAEAIAVNDQRLSATSTIRAAGGTILVDFRPVSSPYTVAAVGPEDLDKRFAGTDTGKRFRRYVDQYRMQFDVRKQERLTLPAAADPRLRYARPLPAGGGG